MSVEEATYLKTEGQQGQDRWIARLVKTGNVGIQALGKSRQEIKRDNEKGLVGFVVLGGIGGKRLVLEQRLMHNLYAAFKDGLGIVDKSIAYGNDN